MLTLDPANRVRSVYLGSNGGDTTDLYHDLGRRGAIGVIALNLFRAQKCSDRAKTYRRGSHKRAAYERKQWSMDLLSDALLKHAERFSIDWGWSLDHEQPVHQWVLYVELPQGQVSFHTEARGIGPEYSRPWDRAKGASVSRILAFCADVLSRPAIGE